MFEGGKPHPSSDRLQLPCESLGKLSSLR